VRRLRAGDIPEEDLEKARSYLAGNYPLRIESPESLATEDPERRSLRARSRFHQSVQKRVRAVTADA